MSGLRFVSRAAVCRIVFFMFCSVLCSRFVPSMPAHHPSALLGNKLRLIDDIVHIMCFESVVAKPSSM